MSSFGSPPPPPPFPSSWGHGDGGSWGTGPPGGGPTGPGGPGGGYPGGPGASRRLCRSTTNRRIAGVAGGLAEYLGVDANFVRFAFVILAFFGTFGVLAYGVAWVVLPEGSSDGPYRGQVAPIRPWQEWDRSARSWAVVLGAVALALTWSFVAWPWWRWDAIPFWAIVLIGFLLWANARHPHPGPGPGPVGPATMAAGAPGPGPGGQPVPAPGPSGAASGAAVAASVATAPTGTVPPPSSTASTEEAGSDPTVVRGPGRAEEGSQSPFTEVEADPARIWDYAFIDPVATRPSSTPPPRTAAPGAVPGAQGASTVLSVVRVLATTVAAVFMALVVAAVIAVVAITLSSGASFRGGAGSRTYTPLTAAGVQAQYHLGAGNLTLDLAGVKFAPGTVHHLDATVGLGELTVQVPADVQVDVKANVGLGTVDVFNQSGSSVRATSPPKGSTGAGRAAQVDLVAHVGEGEITVTRS